MGLRILGLGLLAAVIRSACAPPPNSGPDSTPQEAAAAAYRHPAPPSITLYTMISNRTGSGAHTSIMINAPSQRVIFDPAGSVGLSFMPEIGDVLYGITPRIEDWYERAHARETYHVRIQKIEVPGPVAEQALRMVQSNGHVAGAQCTTVTSRILGQLPGFESINTVMFPTRLADQFARLPGVTERKLFENDADDKTLAQQAFERQVRMRAGQPDGQDGQADQVGQ